MIRNVLGSFISAILFFIVGLIVVLLIDKTGVSTNNLSFLNTLGEMNTLTWFSNSTLNGLALLVFIVSIIIFISGFVKGFLKR
ncbi:hypothetical protein BUY18_11180 [Staphylococcus cohnii]|uniref:hypothetical protein n=1 Tax=Staphylococcus ureilyticus TaxID=94138 RepID=UPI000D1C900A|nr:hypothetical protein [Staphylococcus ureilyticus]MBM9448522.1 hypothetical protein [Staphylococcus ureilyticus]PTF44901.1 hypothetical protein BUY18_11180 [Staphylococcus cohnii]